MNAIIFTEKSWYDKLIEWKFNNADESGARYGMIALGKSQDQKYIDCMYVLYKMDFKIKRSIMSSFLRALLSWFGNKQSRGLTEQEIKKFRNFFRLKALEEFYKEGLINSISFVDSLEQIPETANNY